MQIHSDPISEKEHLFSQELDRVFNHKTRVLKTRYPINKTMGFQSQDQGFPETRPGFSRDKTRVPKDKTKVSQRQDQGPKDKTGVPKYKNRVSGDKRSVFPERLVGLKPVLTGGPVVGKRLQIDARHFLIVVDHGRASSRSTGLAGVGAQLAEAVA
jgi:hypothetical protein